MKKANSQKCHVLCYYSPLETRMVGVYKNYDDAVEDMKKEIETIQMTLLCSGRVYRINNQNECEFDLFEINSHFYHTWKIMESNLYK